MPPVVTYEYEGDQQKAFIRHGNFQMTNEILKFKEK